MTREEAIKEIIDMANVLQLIPNTPKGRAVSMAIQALEQEPCEDAVSRETIMDELNRLGRNAFKDDTDYDNFFAFVDGLLPVTPQEPKNRAL